MNTKIEGLKKHDKVSIFDKKGNDKFTITRYNSYIEVVRRFGAKCIAGGSPAR